MTFSEGVALGYYRLKFPGKNCRQLFGESKASDQKNLSTSIKLPFQKNLPILIYSHAFSLSLLLKFPVWYSMCHSVKQLLKIRTLRHESAFLFSIKKTIQQSLIGLIWVSGKLPTYPSSTPSFCPKREVSVNVSLGKG